MRAFSPFEMDRIIRTAGAERVGEDASIKLNEILADVAGEIVFQARILARHAGRSRLNAEDILLASKMV